MKSYGICPASCGEFVQGMIKEKEYLSSYAINLFSKVTLEEKINDINTGPSKARKAMEEVFKYFNLPKDSVLSCPPPTTVSNGIKRAIPNPSNIPTRAFTIINK